MCQGTRKGGYGALKPRIEERMMEPEAPSPPRPVPPLGADCPAESGATSSGIGPSTDGAACHEQATSGDESSTSAEVSEDESDSEEDIFSGEESEGDGLQSDDGREQVESVAAAGSATADSPPAAVLEQQVPVQEQAPAGSDSLLTAAALEERANKMFVVGSAAPQASAQTSKIQNS